MPILPCILPLENFRMDRKGEIFFKTPTQVEWKVSDFFSLPEDMNYTLESPSFRYMERTWCLGCYPNAPTRAKMLIYLRGEKSASENRLMLRLGIKRIDGLDFINCCRFVNYSSHDQSFGVNLFLNKTDLLDYKNIVAPRDAVTFFCIFPSEPNKDAMSPTVQPEGRSVATETTQEDFSKSDSRSAVVHGTSKKTEGAEKLAQNLKDALLNGEHCDTIIKVQGQDFQAHKFILAARSPVFASMFRHDTTERNTGLITVEDCDPRAFKEFVSFLYSGEVENASAENVTDLYYIADKYQVEEVKSKCVNFMMKHMSVETFCDFITLALRHNEAELLKFATDYFVKNIKSIIVTVQWQSFHREYPTESNELHIKAVAHWIP